MTDHRQEALERMLAQAADEEREIQREVDAELRAEDAALAREFVDRQLAPPGPSLRRPWVPLAAAAAVLLLWLGWSFRPQPDLPAIHLGGSAIELLAPVVDGDPWEELRWSGELKAGEKWTVQVQLAGPDGEWVGTPKVQTKDNFMPLTASMLDDSVTEIRWRVDCLAMGVSSGWLTVRRTEKQ